MPSSWQGWVVLAAFAALAAAGFFMFPANERPGALFAGRAAALALGRGLKRVPLM